MHDLGKILNIDGPSFEYHTLIDCGARIGDTAQGFIDFNDGTYLAINMDQVIFFKEEIEKKKVEESAPALVID